MLTYRGITFTQDICDELTATIGRAPDDAVMSYIRSHPELRAGGRLVKNSCPLFRKRIVQHIRILHELDEDAARLLYESGLGQAFVVVLSSDVLKKLLYQLAALLGRRPLALALLLDCRDTVRGLGHELALSEAGDMPADEARGAIGETLAVFNRHYFPACGMAEAVPDSASPGAGADTDAERKLRAEVRRNAELSERLKEERESHASQLDEKKSRIEALSVELEQCKRELVRVRHDAERKAEELENERRARDSAIAGGIREQLRLTTNSWLGTRVRTDEALAALPQGADILAEADQALARQARADRHTGNRRQLRERLAAVSAKLHEVRDARANAIHPVDGLERIEARLAGEEGHISALLGVSAASGVSPLAAALAARISRSRGDETRRLEELYGELRAMGLAPADTAYLQRCFGDRYDRLVAEHGDAEIPVKPLNPALRFRAALGAGRPVMLFCDGHNLLNCMEQFREASARSHAEARSLLVGEIRSMLDGYQLCSAFIVFDGPHHNRERVSENLAVIYSGGGANEAHRADKRIAEMLNWQEHTGSGEQVFVVSADHEVAADARSKGAEVIPLEQFGWLLGSAC